MSTHRTHSLPIARRYAAALFALANEAGAAPAVTAEFQALARAIETHTDLAEVLASPLVSHAEKAAVLTGLMAKAAPLTTQALATLAEAGRASLVPLVAEQLKTLLDARQGEVEAVVTSARALPASTQQQLAQALANATGKTVRLKLKENPAVLGGVAVELGSLKLDATLAGALADMKHQLLASAH